jgi:hypothetical protein
MDEDAWVTEANVMVMGTMVINCMRTYKDGDGTRVFSDEVLEKVEKNLSDGSARAFVHTRAYAPHF